MIPKLVVVDIDGTLLIRANEISPANLHALDEVQRRGVQVSLCTGRAIPAARTVLEQLNLDGYHIFSDGALVMNPRSGDGLYARTIPHDLLCRAARFARASGIFFDAYSATECFAEQESWVTQLRREYFKVSPRIIDFAALPASEKVIKGTLVVRTEKEKAAASRFRQEFDGQLDLSLSKTPAYPDVDFINVVAPGVSKRAALGALTAHLGISPAEVMAIGDGPNDLPILTVVGLAVAMGNAAPEVKAAAHHVTEDVEHDGVAAALKKFVLGERPDRG